MIKKRYISPATHIVQMYELESAILYNSFVSTRSWVDETHNMNADESYDKETFLIEF